MIRHATIGYKTGIVLCVLLYCVCFAHAQNADKYFEGTVTYSIEYAPLMENVLIDKIQDYFGTQLVFSMRNGFTKKVFSDRNGKIVQTRFFDPVNNISSYFSNRNDTLYQYHPYKNDFNTLAYEKLKDTVIDGITLQGTKVVGKSKTDAKRDVLTYCYYFDKKLKVDPSYFKRCNEGEWAKIIEQYKSVLYYYTIQHGDVFIAKYKAIKITPQHIDQNFFILPTNYFLQNIDDRSGL